MTDRFLKNAALAGALTIAGLSTLSTPVNAANLTGAPAVSSFFNQSQSPACSAGSIAGFADCVGSYALGGQGQPNNDVTDGAPDNLASRILATGVFGGITNWTFDAKRDNGLTGPNTLGFTLSGLNTTSGVFNFSNIDLTKTALAISLKSSRGFSIYYAAAGTLTSGSGINWNTLGVSTNNGGQAQELSHASVYFYKQPGTNPVPTPALLPGLIGMGVAAFRKRQATKDAALVSSDS